MRPVLFAILLGVSGLCIPRSSAPLQPRRHPPRWGPGRHPRCDTGADRRRRRHRRTRQTTPVSFDHTDARGEFELSLAPGRYTVTATADGFVELVQRLSVSPADTPAPELRPPDCRPPRHCDRERHRRLHDPATMTATKTPTPLRDVPQSVTVVTKDLIQDQLMMSVGDVMRYVPGVSVHQGENNRDQVIIRGNSSSADFYVDGVRDDVQYYRDLYNVERIEALKGPNAMMFGRGGAGGVVNRVMKEARIPAVRRVLAAGRDEWPQARHRGFQSGAEWEESRSGSTACSRTRAASGTTSPASQGHQPDRDVDAEQSDHHHRSLRIPRRLACRRPRHHVVSGPPGRRP